LSLSALASKGLQVQNTGALFMELEA